MPRRFAPVTPGLPSSLPTAGWSRSWAPGASTCVSSTWGDAAAERHHGDGLRVGGGLVGGRPLRCCTWLERSSDRWTPRRGRRERWRSRPHSRRRSMAGCRRAPTARCWSEEPDCSGSRPISRPSAMSTVRTRRDAQVWPFFLPERPRLPVHPGGQRPGTPGDSPWLSRFGPPRALAPRVLERGALRLGPPGVRKGRIDCGAAIRPRARVRSRARPRWSPRAPRPRGLHAFCAGDGRHLVYVPHDCGGASQLAWYDRAGPPSARSARRFLTGRL